MTKLKVFAVIASFVIVAIGCGTNGTSDNSSKGIEKDIKSETKMKKTLVAYFSASGVTAGKAELIAKIAGADTYEIRPKIPYQAEDLDWENETSRSTLEMKDLNCRPEIAPPACNMEQYEIVFVGFPIWWFREPSIIDAFLESYDFSGKTIIPFATSLGSDMGNTEKRLREICKGTPDWADAKILTNFDETEIREWVESLDL